MRNLSLLGRIDSYSGVEEAVDSRNRLDGGEVHSLEVCGYRQHQETYGRAIDSYG